MNAPSAPFVGTVATCNYLEPDDTTIIDSEFNNAAFKPLLLLPPSTEREKNNPPSRSRSPFGRRAFHEDQPYPLPHPLLLPSESKDSLIRPYYLSSSPKSPVLLLDIKTPSKPHTSRKRSDSAALWLGVYFMLNLTLTLYNKSVLIHFPFPYTLTALHAFCGSIGTTVLLHWNWLSRLGAPLAALYTGRRRLSSSSPSTLPAPLNRREKCVLFLFSILYTVNIIVSNASLKLVTVPFHQVVRASAPLFTIFLSAVLLGKHSSRAKLISLIPVIAGVGFATYGDYYFTPWGFFLTLLGTVLAALKTILTNLLQTPFVPSPVSSPTTMSFAESLASITRSRRSSISSKQLQLPSGPTSSTSSSLLPLPTLSLPPLHLLYLLSPLAFMQTTLLAYFTGELHNVWIHLSTPGDGNINANMGIMAVGVPCSWLFLNGVLAFFLNVVSFNANRRVGPLGMGVASNVKQVLAVLLSVTLFQLTITPTNGLGIALTLLGGAWYTSVELQERKRRMHLL
ncbi:hypothetical protein K443DRAFT_684387 [Laccaria amethystina LaAM-08-1]|uniref:Sugar phosphate transporter domain-containing protein n=1 Tax=Laccaria amethystina LaAM-08-1 TaxID=1095629 RepID=A0A0C9X7Q8_9AGAR|nr:hypothetical protein K443DRAFT_684387 [Laccaria amethystina LaAM-08-1]